MIKGARQLLVLAAVSLLCGSCANTTLSQAATPAGSKSTSAAPRSDQEAPLQNASAAGSQPAAKPPGKSLDALVNDWMRRPDIIHSQVGVEVMELPSGRVLFSHEGGRRFTPASTAKVLTTACAYATLGPNFTYSTQLLATGKVEGDTAHGDIVLLPSQDPSFSRDDLRELFNALRDKGVHKVDGTLKLGEVRGGYDVFEPGWLVEDFGQNWMPVCSNLVLDGNVAQGVANLHGVKTAVLSPSDNYNALERCLLASDIASGWVTYDARARELKAYIGNGVTPKSPLAVTNPDEYNLAVARDMLQDMGIPADREKAGAPAVTLAQHLSKPLSVLIQHTLHESDNLYAQQLLRTLGLSNATATGKAVDNKDAPRLEDVGLGRLNHWLASIGVPQSEVVVFDGCGLSRKDSISPHALNSVLKFMAGPKVDGPYLNLLRASGRGGGSFRYKTGSMDTVSTVSGIVETVGGHHLAVTVMVNAHNTSIRHLRGTINGLVDLFEQIKSITIVPAPVPTSAHAGTDGTGTAPDQPSYAVVELAHPPAHAATKSRGRTSHRRRRH